MRGERILLFHVTISEQSWAFADFRSQLLNALSAASWRWKLWPVLSYESYPISTLIIWCCFSFAIACSRLSVVGDERKRARKRRGRKRVVKEILTGSLPSFLALVLPHFFSRSPFFFSPNYREPGTGYPELNVQTKLSHMINFVGIISGKNAADDK